MRSAGQVHAAQEGAGDNRSVMPSDALGCTRNTISLCWINGSAKRGTGACNGAANEEFLVTAAHQAAVNVSL